MLARYRTQVQAPSQQALRLGCLAVSVLRDVDLQPGALGVTLTGTPDVWVSWGECRRALAGHDPEGATGRVRLADWLLARRWAADAGAQDLALALRPAGLPVGHVLHPGLDWVRDRVLGGVLDLGLAGVGLDPVDPDRVVLLPTTALDAAGLDHERCWQVARERLEVLGALVAERVRRDPKGQLRPFGDCDAVTLLGARSLRADLAATGGGLGAAVVPMRRRGWTRLALIDPAFGPAAAAATPAVDRGFARPLLITADEVTLVPEGGRTELVLRDPAVDASWVRSTPYV